jgi:alkylation response protein AidB-like acyl-CoA dehydrogenase
LGMARRALDEICALANASSGRPAALPVQGGGEIFYLQYAQAEASLRAARSFVFDIWDSIQTTLARGNDPTVRQMTLARLAFINANSVANVVTNLAYDFGGGVALRSSVIQRCFRDQKAAAQHINASKIVTQAVAKELLGLIKGRAWSLIGLVD